MSKKPTIKRRKKGQKPLTRTQSRYRFDETFSGKAKDASKRRYRSEKGADFELTGNVILRALDYVEDYAEPMPVNNEITGEAEQYLCILPTVLAKLLNTSYQTIWRWTSETGQLPEFALTKQTGRGGGVYHVEEARIIIRHIGEHLKAYKYYRKDHTGVRDRMFNEIQALRDLNYGVQDHGSSKARKVAPSQGKKRPRVRKRSAR